MLSGAKISARRPADRRGRRCPLGDYDRGIDLTFGAAFNRPGMVSVQLVAGLEGAMYALRSGSGAPAHPGRDGIRAGRKGRTNCPYDRVTK